MTKKRIIVICTANSARSQMSEGFFRHYGENFLEIFSAGIHPSYVHHVAIDVMLEKGINIKDHTSDSINKYYNDSFDYVITVCDSAQERCPMFPNTAHQIHIGFADPSSGADDEDSLYDGFRSIRDQIEECVIEFLKDKGWYQPSS